MSCFPLKPASLLTFLPEQESKAPAGSARSQFRTEPSANRYCPSSARYRSCGGSWGVDNLYQVPPHPKPSAFRLRAPSVTANAVPAPSRRELRRVAADNAHGGFLQFGTSLTCPVSLPSKMGNENIGTMHALPAAARRPARYRYRAKWGTKISVLCTHCQRRHAATIHPKIPLYVGE